MLKVIMNLAGALIKVLRATGFCNPPTIIITQSTPITRGGGYFYGLFRRLNSMSSSSTATPTSGAIVCLPAPKKTRTWVIGFALDAFPVQVAVFMTLCLISAIFYIRRDCNRNR